MVNRERESICVLKECIELQQKKSNDYQNPNSTIRQSDYYPSGCLTILETIQAKVYRMRSVMEAMINDPNYKPNFESMEDSAKDLINYASFFVSYSRGKIDGQTSDRDFLNRKKIIEEKDTIADNSLNKSVIGGYVQRLINSSVCHFIDESSLYACYNDSRKKLYADFDDGFYKNDELTYQLNIVDEYYNKQKALLNAKK